MIGYYVHHRGRGHLHRAIAIADALDEPVTILSSVSPEPAWGDSWVHLPPDDHDDPVDPTAGGFLHWAPIASAGMRARMAAISSWIAAARPRAIVVDVSVEVALLARLHGIPVVVVALPGIRDDAVHTLGYGVASAVIAAWPAAEGPGPVVVDRSVAARIEPVGAISRYTAPPARAAGDSSDRSSAACSAGATDDSPEDRRVLVLAGAGGGDVPPAALDAARRSTPDWSWGHVGGASGVWLDDPWPAIRRASVVVTHAGESAIAEVAAARRPCIVVAQDRPHDEQRATARVLERGGWPAIVVDRFPTRGWPELLDRAQGLDAGRWAGWNDGGGAERAAAVIRRVADGHGR